MILSVLCVVCVCIRWNLTVDSGLIFSLMWVLAFSSLWLLLVYCYFGLVGFLVADLQICVFELGEFSGFALRYLDYCELVFSGFLFLGFTDFGLWFGCLLVYWLGLFSVCLVPDFGCLDYVVCLFWRLCGVVWVAMLVWLFSCLLYCFWVYFWFWCLFVSICFYCRLVVWFCAGFGVCVCCVCFWG